MQQPPKILAANTPAEVKMCKRPVAVTRTQRSGSRLNIAHPPNARLLADDHESRSLSHFSHGSHGGDHGQPKMTFLPRFLAEIRRELGKWFVLDFKNSSGT